MFPAKMVLKLDFGKDYRLVVSIPLSFFNFACVLHYFFCIAVLKYTALTAGRRYFEAQLFYGPSFLAVHNFAARLATKMFL